MGGLGAEFTTLFVGWALGILSSPITDAIRRWSVKQRISRAVRSELMSLQDALALVVIYVSHRRGLMTRSLLEAIQSTLRTSGHTHDASKAIRQLEDLAAAGGVGITAAAGAVPPKPRDGRSLKVQGLPFIDAHVHRLDFYSHEVQRQILELRSGIHIFNELAGEAAQYHFLSFREGASPELMALLNTSFESSCDRAAETASELISQAAALLQSRELRGR